MASADAATVPRTELETIFADVTAQHPSIPVWQVRRVGERPLGRGGYAEVYPGDCFVRAEGHNYAGPIALKIFMYDPSKVEGWRFLRRLVKEVTVWSGLQHRNIIPFLGLCLEGTSYKQVSIVMPLMLRGSLRFYLTKYPGANRIQLLRGIADGLLYLHTRHPVIIHGDLKCANVLVDDQGVPLLADFGLSVVMDDLQAQQVTTTLFNINPRWAAPERLDPSRYGMSQWQAFSKASDMYSLGMTVYEMTSGQVPFAGLHDFIVANKVLDQARPFCPGPTCKRAGLTTSLRSFLERAWCDDPSERPDITTLVTLLATDGEILRWLRDGADAIEGSGSSSDAETWTLSSQSAIMAQSNGSSLTPLSASSAQDERLQNGHRHGLSGIESLMPSRDDVLAWLRAVGIPALTVPNPYGDSHAPVTSGAWAEIYRSFLPTTGMAIAVKRLRDTAGERLKRGFDPAIKRATRVAAVWHLGAGHPNVLPLLGVAMRPKGSLFDCISPWMSNGNAREFGQQHPDEDFTSLISDILRGLSYLHSKGIVHRDIKGENILVDSAGRGIIGGLGHTQDYYLSPEAPYNGSSLTYGSIRWMAPERLESELSGLNWRNELAPPSDVYSAASTMLELTTLNVPWFEVRNTFEVPSRINSTGHPPRPAGDDHIQRGLTHELWELMERCWAWNPEDRPTADEALQTLTLFSQEEGAGNHARVSSVVPELPPIDLSLSSWGILGSARSPSESAGTFGFNFEASNTVFV